MSAQLETVEPPILRKLTHEQARTEQRLYWSRKSYVERLTAMTKLNREMVAWRGIDLDEQSTDWTAHRVTRRKR